MSAVDNNNLMENDTSIEEITKDQYLTFVIDNEEYAIDIAYIKEIINMEPITSVPHSSDYIEGIISLRGDIIPVINVRRRFIKPVIPFDELTCIVVVEYEDYQLGLVVDDVKEVIFIYEEFIVAPPSAKLNYYNQFIKNIGKVGNTVKLLLDLDRFLLDD